MNASAGVAVVLPVKAFGAAKQRLRHALDDGDRARLARHLAGGVVRAASADGSTRVVVACDDAEVRAWAAGTGAEVAWTPGLGLNGAIDAGVDLVIEGGAAHVVVAHADLARPGRLLDVVGGPLGRRCITVVPDRRRDGTNVVAYPSDARFRADYGPGSFERHRAAARRAAVDAGCPMRVLPDADLALDVDTVGDLLHPSIHEELPPWLRIHQDSRSTRVG